MSLREKIIGIVGVVVGILVSIQGVMGYYNDELSWCKGNLSYSCPPKDSIAIANDEFLVVLGVVFVCLGIGLFYLSRAVSSRNRDLQTSEINAARNNEN